jgi:hypothetical protein
MTEDEEALARAMLASAQESNESNDDNCDEKGGLKK